MRRWPFRRRTEIEELPEPPAPARLTYAVGDIHGCDAQLMALLRQINADRDGRDADLVFLGDYVDRGPESARVLRRLRAMERSGRGRVHCLMGNHDRLMLEFLAGGLSALRWLELGGAATLASFGVGHVPARSIEERLERIADALRAAIDPATVAWLEARPLWWRSGTLVAVHALTDPDLPMEAQSDEVLLWQRPPSTPRPRTDGLWVVHGHTIVRVPQVRAGHVNVDTGAFRGGPLTAAVFDGGPPRFLMASRSES